MSKPEFILCAAIDYNGIIICGHRHGDCYKTLCELLHIDKDDEHLPDRSKQGFLTSLNRYVGRSEAFKIAKSNNQIWHNIHDGIDENFLTSEDLY